MSIFIRLFIKVVCAKIDSHRQSRGRLVPRMLVTMGDDVTKTIVQNLTPSTTGRVLHSAALYDLLLWLVTLGRERGFREKVLRLAHLEPGQSVLDVGCGTGTLAIAAKRHVGPTGRVHGIDAS